MEIMKEEDSFADVVNLTKVSLGQWQLFLREEPDLHMDNKPFVALTMMYHPDTHEYAWRVLGRLVESGTAQNYKGFLNKCFNFFNMGAPCLGMMTPDVKFPQSCLFSENCSIMVSKSNGGITSCQACIQSSEDPVKLCSEIRDFVEDIIYNHASKCFNALQRKVSKMKSCPICSVEIPLPKMKTHLEQTHFLSHFVCFHCDDRFVDAKDLCFHTLQEHPEIQEVFCPSCPRSIPINDEITCLVSHFRRCCRDKDMALKQDAVEKQASPKLLKVIKRPKTCETLGQSIKDPLDVTSLSDASLPLVPKFDRPKEHETDPSKTMCPMCRKEIGAKFLSRHLMFHHCIGEFNCNSCPWIFQTSVELVNHITDAHPSQASQMCPNCAKQVDIWDRRRRSFIDHIQACHKIIFLTNMKGKRVPFPGTICSDCGQIFVNKADLDHHESQGCYQQVKKVYTGPKSSKTIEGSKISHENRSSEQRNQHEIEFKAQYQNTNVAIANPFSNDSTDLNEILESSIDVKLEPLDSVHAMECSNIEEEPSNQNSNNLKDTSPKEHISHAQPKEFKFKILRKVKAPRTEVPIVPPMTISDQVECDICFRKVCSENLPKHKMFRHQIGQFDCPKCPMKFETAELISEHVIAHPHVSDLQCPNCRQDIDLGTELKGLEDHVETCHKLQFRWDETDQRYIRFRGRECLDCGQRFQTQRHLSEHQQMGICEVGSEDLDHVRNQIQGTESSSEKVILRTCNEIVSSAKSSNNHKRKRHRWNSLCFVCGKIFLNKAQLHFHIRRSHPTIDEFTCEDCGFSAGNDVNLKAHKRSHSQFKFICSSCSEDFATEALLNLHKRRYHPISKDFKFQDGGLIGKDVMSRQRPQESQGQTNLRCPHCGKMFTRQIYLELHSRTHTGEKPDKFDPQV